MLPNKGIVRNVELNNGLYLYVISTNVGLQYYYTKVGDVKVGNVVGIEWYCSLANDYILSISPLIQPIETT